MVWLTSDIIAIASAAVSAGSATFAYRGFRVSAAAHQRALVLQGQSHLVEVNKMLIADPLLWTILDDHPLCCDSATADRRASLEFRSKLEAFVDVVANMFDVMLAELPNPSAKEMDTVGEPESWSPSATWLHFFEDTLRKSSMLRKHMERPEARYLFQPAIKSAYLSWKQAGSA